MAKVNECSVDDCKKLTRQYRTMCDMHLNRLKRRGDINYTRVRRPVTETEAWCNKGQHMVPHAGFAKGQRMCRDCRKAYNDNNYTAGLSCSECGKRVANTSRTLMCRPCRSTFLRSSAPSTRRMNTQGYAFLTGHYWHENANNRGQILEHVKVMSEVLGRPLLPGENVHHINGVRDDNRPENLELWVTSQPSGQRPADLVAWAKVILDRYDTEAHALRDVA